MPSNDPSPFATGAPWYSGFRVLPGHIILKPVETIGGEEWPVYAMRDTYGEVWKVHSTFGQCFAEFATGDYVKVRPMAVTHIFKRGPNGAQTDFGICRAEDIVLVIRIGI